RLTLSRARFVLEGNTRALGQPAHRLGEFQALVLFHEGEDVAALVAAEAFEDLQVRIDVEAGSLFFVKRTKRHEVGAGALQGHVRPNDINNVIGRADLLQGRGGKQAGHGYKVRKPKVEI